MDRAAERAMGSSRRAILLRKFNELPLVAQGEFMHLLELEAVCQFSSGNKSKAIELCEQQIHIETSLFGTRPEALDLLKPKVRLLMFLGLGQASLSAVNEILEEMYCLFCCPPIGLLSSTDFQFLCKRYVANPNYHSYVADWIRERERERERAGRKKLLTGTDEATAAPQGQGQGQGQGQSKQKKKTKKGR
jgi:hypothetical protein